MYQQEDKKQKGSYEKISRREFFQYLGTIVFIVGTGFYVPAANGSLKIPKGLNKRPWGIPPSQGYLLVDMKKCSGCMSCMLACSLVHEGKENVCLSRIQIVQDSFGRFPTDITMAQCRQCEDPLCVKVCETKALQADKMNGNVRIVDERRCIGCMRCVQVCPFVPSRVQWNFETKRAQKCDLCSETPFWNEEGGAGGN